MYDVCSEETYSFFNDSPGFIEPNTQCSLNEYFVGQWNERDGRVRIG